MTTFDGAASGLPDDVAQFLAAHVTSMSEVEVLMLLVRKGRPLSTAQIGKELRLDPYFAALLLDRLCLARLVAPVDDVYELIAGASERNSLERLSVLYDRYRVRIARLILAAAPNADATD